jgi:hypothetical protein
MKNHNNKVLRLDEYMMQEGSCMSEKAKSLLKEACEACLIKEAEEFENDEHESHTYEGYMNECSSYLKEMMGNRGYSDLTKHYKR